jgi:hypothetical protein
VDVREATQIRSKVNIASGSADTRLLHPVTDAEGSNPKLLGGCSNTSPAVFGIGLFDKGDNLRFLLVGITLAFRFPAHWDPHGSFSSLHLQEEIQLESHPVALSLQRSKLAI